jgi:hypothetical protein
MDVYDNAKLRNFDHDKIKDGMRMAFTPMDLSSAMKHARDFKETIDSKQHKHQHQIDMFCVGENLQYKGVLESFLKTTSTNDMQREISFLEFALNMMNERVTYKNDDHNKFYDKVKEILPILEEVLK